MLGWAFLFFLLMVASFGASLHPEIPLVYRPFLAAAGVAFLIAFCFCIYARLYVKPTANKAYVRTGMGGAKVLLDSGGLVFPVVHQLVPVSLETMKLEVERKGHDALITRDNLRVDVTAEFYIKVQPDPDDVIAAARSLGTKGVDAAQVQEFVFEKLVSALRSVAATKDLIDIHANRRDFAQAVLDIIKDDLTHNGLTLETVTISRLDQTDPKLLSDDNVFDAQGKRKITEITQSQLVERNRIQRDAEREIAHKNVETRKQVLELERAQAEAEATQAAEIAKVRAARNRERQEYEIAQELAVQQARISQEQAVREAEIAREIAIIQRELERERQDISRRQAVEVAERQREIAIAEQEARRAEAQRLALEAQAEREKANQQVITVQQLAAAEREAQTRLIAAKQVIEQDRIKRQTDAEVAAFAEVKRAEAELQAAQQRAQARLRLAEAEAQAKKIEAEGEMALKMVDVNVDRERVNVERARVEVERQELENKQTFSQAALEFEIQKLRIEASREVQEALAKAIGEFMSKGQFTIYGDPTTLARMTEQFVKGLGIGRIMDGLVAGAPPSVREAVGKATGNLSELISALIERLTGRPVNAEDVDKLLESAAASHQNNPENPEGTGKGSGQDQK
ncbi:MAG: SPFH domain-containing protein [Armatimonadetes bacterium]|nr:SPFH domain-containing protein [Armatimonadota bacterium]MDW8122483.1 SPFH domain-containing protein [Armatimonadota bacterium]